MNSKATKKKQAKHFGEETVSLRHDFTDKEYRDIGGKLNVSLNELTRLEGELKSISSDYKARIQQQEDQRDELNMKLGNGYEMRQTKVAVVYDPKRSVKTYFAMEDKKRKTPLQEEPMRPTDFQMELPVVAAVAPAPAVVAPGQPLVSVGAAMASMDDLSYGHAIEVVRSESKCSVSLIQRRLKLCYTDASAIVDRMEKEGVVGPATGATTREILALPDPQPAGTPEHDTSNPPPVPAKKKSGKRKPTKAEFKAIKEAEGEGDK